jgi:hypothetical protein
MFNKSHIPLKKILYLALIFGVLYSCLSEGKKTLTEEQQFTAEDFPTIQANIIFLQGKGEAYERMNQIITDSTLASFYLDQPVTSIPAALDAFVKQYESFKTDFPETEQVWELTVETELVFESSTVLTYAINTYSFTGGAHGNDRVQLLSFNPQTGAVFDNSELIRDQDAFREIAEAYFLSSQKDSNANFSMEDFFFGEEFKLPENIGFNEEGLILLYNVYEIASYAQGYTEFVIPYEALDGVLKISPF